MFDALKETLLLRSWSLLSVPMIFWTKPSILEISSEHIALKIPLMRRTRNHLKTMYFGTLAVGADCAGGYLAMKLIRNKGYKISLVFKDMQANFLKRAEGDVHFICYDGAAITQAVEQAQQSKERVNLPVRIIATVPSKLGNEPVADFTLTLSLKVKK